MPFSPVDSHPPPDSTSQAVLKRHNVHVLGSGKPTLLFCNGFNCNQQVWRHLTPGLAGEYQLVLFDQLGAGQSDRTAYNTRKYATLQGYAQDVVEICQALSLRDVVLVGHSAGAMVALLAAILAPRHFAKAVLVAASPHYLNEPGYYGGFERQDVLDLLAAMSHSYQSWANTFAIMMVGQNYPAALAYELTGYFCECDPAIAQQVVELTLFGDQRADLPKLTIPTLLLQCTEDTAVPPEVGEYMLAHLPQATLTVLQATGHFPHLVAPLEVLGAIQQFLGPPPARPASPE